MNLLNDLKSLFNVFRNKKKRNGRTMKRVFQWRRYIEWKDLSYEEKLAAKRLLLVPIFAFLIIDVLNQNFFLIVLFLIGYVIYKKFEKGNILKK